MATNKSAVQKSRKSAKKTRTPLFIEPDAKLTVSGGFDVFYMVLVFVLLAIGLVMLFSASYISSKYDPSTKYNPYWYFIRQGLFAVAGIVAMLVVSKINPVYFKKITPIVFALSILLLIIVLFAYTRMESKPGIKRWMTIPIIKVTFQPSDIAKLGIIMGIAYMLEKYKKKLESKASTALFFFGGLAAVCLLIVAEKHLSGTILVFLIGIGMFYLGGIDKRWFIIGIVFGAVLVTVLVLFRHQLFPNAYQIARIDSFFAKDYDDVNERWQTNQSLFALGSGGFFGLGLGNSIQKYLYMPEPQNDFIFAIVGEELGFFRCLLILILFAMLVARGFIIALRAKSMYERLLVLGISLQIGLQTVLNILVVTDMLPNTGISLPFFSYGGTALTIQLIEMGMVLAVSRSGERRTTRSVKNAGSK